MNWKLVAAILLVALAISTARGAKIPSALLDRLEQPSRDVWLPAAQEVATLGRDGAHALRERRSRVQDPRAAARYDSLMGEIARLHADLSIEPRTLRVGSGFSYAVELRNEMDEKLLIALPADGAEDGVRAPHVGLEITDASGTPVGPSPRWCRAGEIAPLREQDFRWIDSGEKLALFDAPRPGREIGHWYWEASRPGLYRVRFVYDSSALEWRDWNGDGTEARDSVRERWREVHHARVVSDWVTIHVIE